MRARELLDRVGIGEASPDARFGWRILVAVCAIYTLGFIVYYPNVITNEDEAAYVRHAGIVLEGRSTVSKLDALTGESVEHIVSEYPIGTALMAAPFVSIAGWRGAFVVPLLCLVGSTLLVGRWLREEGHSPLWALLVIGYPPALVMGRVAMSDVPSLAVVTLGLWLFFYGIGRGWGYWFASSLIGAASTIWREPNAVLFLPFFAGALLRRERNVWALVAGGLVGVATRLLSSAIMFGSPLFTKTPYVFDLARLGERLPTYLITLLVLAPGGLLLVLFYRGRRRPELIVAAYLFALVYVLQLYFMWGTSPLKRIVLTARYMLPLLPLMALATADVVTRVARRWSARTPEPRRKRVEQFAAAVLAFWMAGVAAGAAAVHPIYAAWSSTQARIRDAIDAHTDREGVLVTNLQLTRKFLGELDRKYLSVSLEKTDADVAKDLAQRYGAYDIVLLDRDDGPYGLQQIDVNANKMRVFDPLEPKLVFDQAMSKTDRLRIWRVGPDAPR